MRAGDFCTVESDVLSVERKIVVVFDICSSTKILEDLKQTDNLDCWRNFLIGLKDWMVKEGSPLHMEPYKFVGDGWILLFPPDSSRSALCDFLSSISMDFDATFDHRILPLLQSRPCPIGLTFGIDVGELVRVEMNGQQEYLGRAINLAARLQAATKTLANNNDYGYQALFSRPSFNSMTPVSPLQCDIDVRSVKVSLKNISGGEQYECFLHRTL